MDTAQNAAARDVPEPTGPSVVSSASLAHAAESNAKRVAPNAEAGMGPRERLILWLTTSACAAVGLAWIAVQLQTGGFAPVALMPIMIGVAVAASIEGLARLTDMRPAKSWLAVACAGGLLVVAAENYFAYHGYQLAYEAKLQSDPKLELFRGHDEPRGLAGFSRFMKSRLAELPVLWTADAALTITAATVWTIFRLRSIEAGTQADQQTEAKG